MNGPQMNGRKLTEEEMAQRMSPPRQPPEEIQTVQMVAQHAMGILGDMLKGGLHFETMVEESFRLADAFDKEFNKRIAVAVAAAEKRSKAAESRIIR